MPLVEKRPKQELRSPSVSHGDDNGEKQQHRKIQKPGPLPLPAPPPRSAGVSEGSGRPRTRSAAPVVGKVDVALPSQQSKANQLSGEILRVNGPSSQTERVNPEDTVKIRTLGFGSSGKVYKVQHKKTNKVYALKIIQDKHEPAVCKQILTEMDILRRARNPYVVQCYGASEKGGEISFLLEYMDGGSLADILKSNKVISERYLADIAMKVLKGLDYLHRNKIVHRDIKPSNILLGRNQEVKIADFGVSTVLASTLAPCNTFVGTCAYMSPERFDPDNQGGHYNGYAADIWSLGLSLLECAIGHYPFISPEEKPDWPTLMFAICYNPSPSPPENASPEFKDFINQCLRKDPFLRPRASTLLAHPFITQYEVVPSSRAHSQQSGGRFWGNFTKALTSIFS
ncbi:hypothetical protein KP509_14G054600 [Ceratopteris richardii]|uniref:mitogen-activated protein kinase kinase n=1 Tax=Ceratopteris richardii TaxID=49495 RepID=A0A8T2TD33_CERRI|nr:hypothetical protein KP509_14G054600 [Ceratopteris richardii]